MQIDRVVPAVDLSAAGLVNTTCAMRRQDAQPGRVCFLQAGERLDEPSAASVCKMLSLSGALHAGDIVVANEGLWHRAFDKDGAAREMERVGEFAHHGSCVPRLRSLGVRLLWRETSAQHFSRSPTGQYKAGCKVAGCGSCGPIADTVPLEALNAAVTTRMQSVGVPVLPLFAATLPLWDAHVIRRSAYVQQWHILDCTHFCEPNTIFTALTPLLLQRMA